MIPFINKIYKYIAFHWVWFKRWYSEKKLSINPKKIVFLTINDMYSCNPKYIAEEFIKRSTDYELVWITNKGVIANNCFFPKKIRIRFNNTPEAFHEIMTAKIIIDNGFKYQEGHYLPKLPGQIYIETWHGSLGLKRFGAKYDSVKSRVKAAKRCGKFTDFCISNSNFETDLVYHGEFWPNATIWEFGHPRNDLLISTDNEKRQIIKNKIYAQYHINSSLKIALYAPTFRDDKSNSHYSLDTEKLRKALTKRFQGDWHILVRYHFINRKIAHYIQENEHVTNVTNYIDMQELLAISDVGITDYSSWICDFVLTKRPAFIFATDIENYNQERGFYYPLSETPFPLSTNNEQLEKNILNFDENSYLINCDNFLKDKGCKENGTATSKTVDEIIRLMEESS